MSNNIIHTKTVRKLVEGFSKLVLWFEIKHRKSVDFLQKMFHVKYKFKKVKVPFYATIPYDDILGKEHLDVPHMTAIELAENAGKGFDSNMSRHIRESFPNKYEYFKPL